MSPKLLQLARERVLKGYGFSRTAKAKSDLKGAGLSRPVPARSIVIPTGADDSQSESSAEWRDLLLMTYVPKILFGLAIAVLRVTPNATFACETSKPLVPLEGAGQMPFYETLGSMEVFKVRKIAGSFESRTLKSIDDKIIDEDTPLPQANLTLKNAMSGQVVKIFTTDSQGRFEIADVSRGLYVLWVVKDYRPSRPLRIEGGLLVELRADAEDVQLPIMALSMSDCGMDVHKKNDETSSDQARQRVSPQIVEPWEVACRDEQVMPNLELRFTTHLLGQLEDRSGAPFSNSKVPLRKLNAQGLWVAFKEVSTDGEGRFDLGSVDPGAYRFLPSPNRGFRQPKHVDCFENSTCEINLVLELNPTDQEFAGCPIQ